MDEDVNDRLARARERAAQKTALEARLRTIRGQIASRMAALGGLDDRLAREEKDVRDLEGKGLTSMFASMLGTKEQRLAKEHEEALRAKLARDACDAALDELEADEACLGEMIAELGDAEAGLAAALQDKEADLVARGDPAARRLADIDASAADARAVSKEVSEAIDAADDALAALARVEGSLGSARNWGTFDMLGGGMIATWAKHSRIDEARAEAHAAQAALDRLARELADVRGSGARGPMVVEIGGFARFADFFFDGLIADWVVQERISQSRANVESVRRDVEQVRDRLSEEFSDLRRRTKSLAEDRARVVESS